MRGLTGIVETARGLVGRKPRFTFTKDGLLKVSYDIGIGINDPENLKFVTWRHCIAYGHDAELIKEAIVGSLINCSGWVCTEGFRDEDGKPVIESGKIIKREYLICDSTELIMRDNVQKDSQLQLGVSDNLVGQAILS